MKTQAMQLEKKLEPVASLKVLLFQDPAGNFFVEVNTESQHGTETFWTSTYTDPQEAVREGLDRSIVKRNYS